MIQQQEKIKYQQQAILFYNLLRIRRIEERLAGLYAKEQEMRCPSHFSIGQEAVAVGVCAQLTKADKIMSAHRSHAHYLAKGGNLKAMVAEMYGKQTGCASGRGGSMHLIDQEAGFIGAVPIVGSTIPISLGAALTAYLQNKDHIVVAFFGDGAVETGVFHESLNFAALHKLPLLMVCENNFYSVLSPLSVRQPSGRQIYQLAEAHGVKSIQADGNNLDEVCKVSGEAVSYIRQGNGPVFLEFNTYRWLEHCGPLGDDHLGYRTTEEINFWKKQDPVFLYADSLLKSGILAKNDIDQFEKDIGAEIEDAVAFAKSSPYPDRSELAKFLYADDNFYRE